jgi:hypothetical protein
MLVVVWMYAPLAVGTLLALKVLVKVVFASERVAVERAERAKNRELRKRLERYSVR